MINYCHKNVLSRRCYESAKGTRRHEKSLGKDPRR